MHIPLETIKNAPGQAFKFCFEIDEKDLDLSDEEAMVQAPLLVEVQVTYEDGQFFVEGSLRTRVVLMCSRCLKSFIFTLTGEIEDEFSSGNEQSEFDLVELVREMYYTNLPLKPLCEETCKGFCADCGENLNEKQCDCHANKVDHRMAVLKKLLEE